MSVPTLPNTADARTDAWVASALNSAAAGAEGVDDPTQDLAARAHQLRAKAALLEAAAVVVAAAQAARPTSPGYMALTGDLPGAVLGHWARIAAASYLPVFTAMATPTADVLSMLLLAAPMVVLYFLALGVALIHDRRKARAELRDIEPASPTVSPERMTPA
jgi:hypothetical protein